MTQRNEKFMMVCLAFLALLGAAVPDARASAPSWVEALSSVRSPAYGLETAAVCLFDETRTIVTDDGEIKDYHRAAYKILTRGGLGLAWLRLSYDGDTKVSDLKAWNL